MTRALFYTTQTNECENHVRAWNAVAAIPAVHLSYNMYGVCNDWQLLQAVQENRYDAVFYIGAHKANGNPKPATLRAVRDHAPLINLCSDAADAPWHPILRDYAKQGCFDLQVAIDGAENAPVDMTTLTPVDPAFFASSKRDIHCGFSGSTGGNRAGIFEDMEGQITIRRRAKEDGYASHAAFLSRCRMVFNVSMTGSGQGHHIKGRVLEAGWAGCALLEPTASPIDRWFPKGSYFAYGNIDEAVELIHSLSNKQINQAAKKFTDHLRIHYSPQRIYGSILERLNVDFAVKKPAP